MKWAEFKQLTVGEIIDFTQVLAEASSVEEGAVDPGRQWEGVPIEDAAKELVLTFMDAATPFTGTLELLADTAIAAVSNSTDWVDKALGLARFAAPALNARPLANLPF